MTCTAWFDPPENIRQLIIHKDLLDCGRFQAIQNGSHLALQRVHALSINIMFEEVQGFGSEWKFMNSYMNVLFSQSFENTIQTLEIRFPVRTCNKEIIYICVNEVETSKDIADETLERLCRISQTKRHSLRGVMKTDFEMSSAAMRI